MTRSARPAARSAIWSTRWRRPRPAPRPWCFATSASITPRLKARVDDFARALLAVGIGRGDRVALLCTNRTEWMVAAFAAAKIGAVGRRHQHLLDARASSPDALEHSGAAALITLEPFRGRHFLEALREPLPGAGRLPRPARSGARGCRPCAPSSCWTATRTRRRSSRCRSSWRAARRRCRGAGRRAAGRGARTTSASSSTPRAPPRRPRA